MILIIHFSLLQIGPVNFHRKTGQKVNFIEYICTVKLSVISETITETRVEAYLRKLEKDRGQYISTGELFVATNRREGVNTADNLTKRIIQILQDGEYRNFERNLW